MPKLSPAELARVRASAPPPETSRRKPIKVYRLYPHQGSWTCKSEHYTGMYMTVAAQSVRQALYLAYNGRWINPNAPRPGGIVSIYERDCGYRLWCRCTTHEFRDPSHGSGIRAIRESINSHKCDGRSAK